MVRYGGMVWYQYDNFFAIPFLHYISPSLFRSKDTIFCMLTPLGPLIESKVLFQPSSIPLKRKELVTMAHRIRLATQRTVLLAAVLLGMNLMKMVWDVNLSSLEKEREQGMTESTLVPPTSTEEKRVDKAPLKTERRKKAIFCGAHHSPIVIDILKREFQYEQVPQDSDDWDIIYGGYPHCGSKPFDWEMKTGLNQRLNEQGWSNLQQHQVYEPCMGCKQSYCEKNGLCEIQRKVDPASCYHLPEDGEKVKAQMDGSKLWVLKRDGRNMNLHAGSGVSYVKTAQQLPNSTDGSYLVQPYKEPYLGEGEYRRKAELRVYLAITSLKPLRVYMYPRLWAVLAGSIYTSSADVDNRCIHDTHAHAKQKCDGGLTVEERQLSFEEYSEKVKLSEEMGNAYIAKTKHLLAQIIHGAHQFEAHYVNLGLYESGASCFSYMRADLGITEEGEPVLFEINEFPYVNEEAKAARRMRSS